MSKVLSFMCLCLLSVGIADAQQTYLADDFGAGISSRLYDQDNVGRDAAIVRGVLFQNSAELGLNKGQLQLHEVWFQNGAVLSTKQSYSAPVKLRVLWAHQSPQERNDYFAFTVRGDKLEVVGDGAYKQVVLQNGVSFVVHTSGKVQLVEVKNGKTIELASEKVAPFPEAGRVHWFAIELTDNRDTVEARITPAYKTNEAPICSLRAKPTTKFNAKANKVFLCNRQLEQGEGPGNNAWIRELQVGQSTQALAKK